MKKCNQCGLLMDSEIKTCKKCKTDVSEIDEIERTVLSNVLSLIGWITIICGFIVGIFAFKWFEDNGLHDIRYAALFMVWISSAISSIIFFALGSIIHNQKIIVTGMGYEESEESDDTY